MQMISDRKTSAEITNRLAYEGETLNGKRHGFGTCEWPDGIGGGLF
jgi:hypothetical protein